MTLQIGAAISVCKYRMVIGTLVIKPLSPSFCDFPDMLISGCWKCHDLLITTFLSKSHFQQTSVLGQLQTTSGPVVDVGVFLYASCLLQGQCCGQFTFALQDFGRLHVFVNYGLGITLSEILES